MTAILAIRGWAGECARRAVQFLPRENQSQALQLLDIITSYATGQQTQSVLDRAYHDADALLHSLPLGTAAEAAGNAIREAANRTDPTGLNAGRWTCIAVIRAAEDAVSEGTNLDRAALAAAEFQAQAALRANWNLHALAGGER